MILASLYDQLRAMPMAKAHRHAANAAEELHGTHPSIAVAAADMAIDSLRFVRLLEDPTLNDCERLITTAWLYAKAYSRITLTPLPEVLTWQHGDVSMPTAMRHSVYYFGDEEHKEVEVFVRLGDDMMGVAYLHGIVTGDNEALRLVVRGERWTPAEPHRYACLTHTERRMIDQSEAILLMNTAIMPAPGHYTMQLLWPDRWADTVKVAWHTANERVESHVGYPAVQQLFEQLTGIRPEVNREGSRGAFDKHSTVLMLGCRLNYRFSDPKRKAAVGRQAPKVEDYEFFMSTFKR